MAKYRKKPIVIEAEQWDIDKDIEGVTYINLNNQQMGVIQTLEGHMIVSPGDWIITGIKGEKYPVKDEIFKITYEKV